jgi:hypothetical protein
LFVLLFSNNSVFAQSENKINVKPVLSVEIGEADYIHSIKAREPKLANFRGLVMKESWSKNYYPFLNYIFFDEGKSEIPERYIMLKANGIESFKDSLITFKNEDFTISNLFVKEILIQGIRVV